MGIAYQRGALLYDQKRYAMAADEFRKELAQNPNSTVAMSMLALSLTYDRKAKEGIAQAEAAVAADPESAFAHYTVACTIVGPPARWPKVKSFRLFWAGGYIIARRFRLRKARLSAMESVRLNPRNPNFLALMAGIELDLKRPRGALGWADQGLAVHADNLRCLNMRSRALAKLGRVKEARQALQSALALGPQSAEIHAAGGWTHMRTGDPNQAVEHFSESLRLDPNDDSAQVGLQMARQSAARRSASRVSKFGSAVLTVYFCLLVVNGLARWLGHPDSTVTLIVAFAVITVLLVVRSFRRRNKWKA